MTSSGGRAEVTLMTSSGDPAESVLLCDVGDVLTAGPVVLLLAALTLNSFPAATHHTLIFRAVSISLRLTRSFLLGYSSP